MDTEKPKTYIGRPCKYGHGDVRYSSSRNCIECTRLRSILDTPEKRAGQAARSARYYHKHREQVAEASKKARKRNPPDYKKYEARRKPRPPGYSSHYAARRRAAKRKATPAWSEKEEIAALYKTCAQFNKLGPLKYHVDHIIPISSPLVCGLHVRDNLHILPASRNQEKSNKFESDPLGVSDLLWQ